MKDRTASRRRYYLKNREQIQANNKVWRDENPEAVAVINRRANTKYEAANPEKKKAHGAIKRAIARGELERPSLCEHCGDAQFVEASHTDYSKPLDVEWLCRPCHRMKDGLE